MQVTAVAPFIVDPGRGKNWVFVKVDTDAGIRHLAPSAFLLVRGARHTDDITG
jgi:hypothetical protein